MTKSIRIFILYLLIMIGLFTYSSLDAQMAITEGNRLSGSNIIQDQNSTKENPKKVDEQTPDPNPQPQPLQNFITDFFYSIWGSITNSFKMVWHGIVKFFTWVLQLLIYIAIGALCGALLPAAILLVLFLLGFTLGGVAALSLAACCQSPATVAGGMFACMQSIGATASILAFTPKTAVVGAIGGLGYFVYVMVVTKGG